jgi:hypothetical protein
MSRQLRLEFLKLFVAMAAAQPLGFAWVYLLLIL